MNTEEKVMSLVEVTITESFTVDTKSIFAKAEAICWLIGIYFYNHVIVSLTFSSQNASPKKAGSSFSIVRVFCLFYFLFFFF